MINEIKNLGIPCYSPIDLKLYEMTLSCAKNKVTSIDKEREIRRELYKRYTKDLEHISLSKYKEISTYINFLCNNNSYGEFTLTDKTLLRNTFIDIDGNFIRSHLQVFEDISNKIKNNTVTRSDIEFIKNNYPCFYSSKEKYTSILEYIVNELEYYKELYNKLISANIDNKDLFNYYEESLDNDKLGLFLVYNYLNNIDNAINNKDYYLANIYLFYVSGYFNTIKNNKTNIIINNAWIDYNYLYKRYISILNNDNIKEVLLGRSVFLDKDVIDNKNAIESLLNIDNIYIKDSFVKKGKGLSNNVPSSKKEEPVTIEELKLIKKYLEERYYIYLKNKPLVEINCINSFNNYVAFLYENGYILADRLRNINRISECNKDAIYVFSIDDFMDKIKLDKGELRGNTKRIMHTSSWNDKVEEILSLPSKDKEHIKEFIKKYK